jgi:tetratricopeptide (TPR) repeat protein
VPIWGSAGQSAARWVPLVVASISCLVFAGLWNDGWLNWDDTLHVTENTLLNPITIDGIARFWTHAYRGLYIPVAYMLFAAESVGHLQHAVTLGDPHPDRHKAYAALANALHRQGRIAESADVYRDALRIAPKRGDLHNDYGSLLASQGRFAEAAESFSKAIKLGFDHAEVRRYLEQTRRLGDGRRD